jgi:DNA-binding transcriptional ArsR family regulator
LWVNDQSVSDLAQPFRVSRPAISQHLRILLEAGLVSESRYGRQRRYHLRAERLREIERWLLTYQRFWRAHLRELGNYLEAHDDR